MDERHVIRDRTRRKLAEIGIKINLPRELFELIEQDAAAIGLGKTTYIRMLLYQHYKSRGLQPRLVTASPLPPGAKGLERVGEDDRADEAQPFIKEKAGGGEGG